MLKVPLTFLLFWLQICTKELDAYEILTQFHYTFKKLTILPSPLYLSIYLLFGIKLDAEKEVIFINMTCCCDCLEEQEFKSLCLYYICH